jgi:hypothetical protein
MDKDEDILKLSRYLIEENTEEKIVFDLNKTTSLPLCKSVLTTIIG